MERVGRRLEVKAEDEDEDEDEGILGEGVQMRRPASEAWMVELWVWVPGPARYLEEGPKGRPGWVRVGRAMAAVNGIRQEVYAGYLSLDYLSQMIDTGPVVAGDSFVSAGTYL